MMSEAPTLLAYIPGEGVWYRLHPLAKGFACILAVLGCSLHHIHPVMAWTAIFMILLLAQAGGIPVRPVVRSLKSLWFLAFFLVVVHVGRDGADAWIGIADSLGRMVGVFLCAALFITVSSQSELLVFWEGCLRPLGIIGISVREAALVMVIAVRFLPVILDELERIKMAQLARGAKFDEKMGLVGAARRLMPLLIPTLVLSINRANDLALAMEARCYRLQGPRTRYHRFHIQFVDVLMVLVVLAGFVGCILN